MFFMRNKNNTMTGFTPPAQELAGRLSAGKGEYQKIGEDHLEYFKVLCGLQKNARVLDIGCGLGRMAIPVLRYLKKPMAIFKKGKAVNYHGVDICNESVVWCQNNISPKYPNARFEWMDVFNKLYNPKGKYPAAEYRFSFPDESFDFILLTSVFTHMLADEIENYLSEIHRMLKKGGICFITYFILNEESIQLVKENKDMKVFIYGLKLNVPPFDQKLDRCYSNGDTKVPEKLVAFKEAYIRSLYEKNGLEILDGIHYGCWCGRPQYVSYQDFIVSVKK
jgi:SAM-dependent methyltransferase